MNSRKKFGNCINIQLFAETENEENVVKEPSVEESVPDEPTEPEVQVDVGVTAINGAKVITKRRPANVMLQHDMNSDEANEYLFREIGREIAVGKDVLEEQLLDVSIDDARPGKQQVVTLPRYSNLSKDFDNIGLPFEKNQVKRSIKPTNVGEMVIGVILHSIPHDMVEEFEVTVDDKPFTRRIIKKPTYVPRQLAQNIRETHSEYLPANISLIEATKSEVHEEWTQVLSKVYNNRDNSTRVPVLPRYTTYDLSSRHNNALENNNMTYVDAYLKDNKAHIELQCKSIDNRVNVNLLLSSFNFANLSHDIMHMIASAIENIELAFECYNESIKMLLKSPEKYGTFLDNTALSGVRSVVDPILALRGDNKKCDTYVDLLTSGFYKRFYGKIEKTFKNIKLKFPRYTDKFIERIPMCSYDAENERLIVCPKMITSGIKSIYQPSRDNAPVTFKAIDNNYTTLSTAVYDPFYVGLVEALNSKQYDLNTAQVLRKILKDGIPTIFNPYQPAYALCIIIAAENIINHCVNLINMFDIESYNEVQKTYADVFNFITGEELFNNCDLELLKKFARPKSNIRYKEFMDTAKCSNFIDVSANLFRRYDAANFTQIPQIGNQTSDTIKITPSLLFSDRKKLLYTTTTTGNNSICPYVIKEIEQYGGIAEAVINMDELYDFLVNDIPFGLVNCRVDARSTRTNARPEYLINKDITYLDLIKSPKRSSISYDIMPSALFPYWYLYYGMYPAQYDYNDGLSHKIFCDNVNHIYVAGNVKAYNDYFNERFAVQSDSLVTVVDFDNNILKRREICNVVPVIFIIRCGTMNQVEYQHACNRRVLNYSYLQNSDANEIIKSYITDSVYPLFELNEGVRYTNDDLRVTSYNELLDKDVDFQFSSSEQLIYPSNIRGVKHKLAHIRYDHLTASDGVFNKVPGLKNNSQVAMLDLYCFDEYKFRDDSGYPVFIVTSASAEGTLNNMLEEIYYNNR